MLYLLVTHIDSYGLNGLIWTHMDPWIDSMQKVFYLLTAGISSSSFAVLVILGTSPTEKYKNVRGYAALPSILIFTLPLGPIWSYLYMDRPNRRSFICPFSLQTATSQLTAVVALSFLSADGRRKTLLNIACN